MDPLSHFFGDLVDTVSDPPYPGTFIATSRSSTSNGGIPGYPGMFDVNNTPAPLSASLLGRHNSLDVYDASEWSLQGGADDSNLDINANPASFCDPALLGHLDSAPMPLALEHSTSSSGLDTRSSATRSSSRFMRPTHSKSTSVSSDIPPAPEPPKKRRGRKPKAVVDEHEEDHKRSTFLEKNRVAASKCRQKKKEYVSELEDTRSGLEDQNSHLQVEYHGLLGQVTQMKNELMCHASCQDPNIDRWIQNEARKFVEGQNSHATQNMVAGGSPHGRRFSTTSGFQMPAVDRPSRRYASTSSRRDGVAYSNCKLTWKCYALLCVTRVLIYLQYHHFKHLQLPALSASCHRITSRRNQRWRSLIQPTWAFHSFI